MRSLVTKDADSNKIRRQRRVSRRLVKYESKYANLLNADSDKGPSETKTFN